MIYKKKPSWYPKLPADYDNKAYIKAFKMLDPPKVPNIKPYSSDKEVAHWVKKAFEEYMKELLQIGYVKQLAPNNWVLTIYAKQIIVNMDILPILLYCGVKISFVDFDLLNQEPQNKCISTEKNDK